MSPPPDDRIRAVAAGQHSVVSVAQAMACGLGHQEIRSRIRRGEYRRLWRGVLLVDADLFAELPWLSRVQAALLRHGPRALAGLGTATRLLDVSGADTPTNVIDVILPRGVERQQSPGIALHFWDVPEASVAQVGAIRCTDAARTLVDLVPRLRRNPAVATIDSALNRRLISADSLPDLYALTRCRPGSARASTWWSLADGRAESPLETWTRLDCTDHGLAPDELQWQVRDDAGVLLGIGDLAWRRGRRRPLVAEADGAEPHSGPRAVFKDRRRANSFVSVGVDIVRVTWPDVRRPGRCAGIVRHALATEPDDLLRRG